MATPKINNQPVIGSNNTIKIPNPNPIKHTAIVFFNALNMPSLPPFVILYCSITFFVIIYVYLLSSLLML